MAGRKRKIPHGYIPQWNSESSDFSASEFETALPNSKRLCQNSPCFGASRAQERNQDDLGEHVHEEDRMDTDEEGFQLHIQEIPDVD